MKPVRLPVVKAEGSPYEMGFMHGQACRTRIREFVDLNLRRLNLTADRALRMSRSYVPHIQRFSTELAEELEGIAEGADISYDEIVFLHVRSHLARQLRGTWCSAFALSRSASSTGGIVLGQNDDFFHGFGELSIILNLVPKSGPRILTYTYPGIIGHIGINSTGLGLCLNAVVSPGWRIGVPYYFIARRLLGAESIEECTEVIAQATRASSMNYLLVDRLRIADIETTVTDYRVLLNEDEGLLVHTNHFLHPDFALQDKGLAELPCSPIRLKVLRELLKRNSGSLDVKKLQEILSNHQNYPYSICRHLTNEPNAIETIASIVAEPSKRLMHVAAGNPCENRVSLHGLE